MKNLRQLILLTLACLPAACASSPPTETPAIGSPTPGGWTAPGEVDDGAPSTDPGWWKTFGDGGLNTAIEECLGNNHDLRIAAVRVDRAEAQAISSGADRLPVLRLQADGAKSQRNFIGFPIQIRDTAYLSIIRLGFGEGIK